MAHVRHAIAEHDFVSLREPIGKWPAGTAGTVVGDYGDVKLIEISSPSPPGEMLDLIQAPEASIELRDRHDG